jgi:hypothetical protein
MCMTEMTRPGPQEGVEAAWQSGGHRAALGGLKGYCAVGRLQYHD